MKSPTPAPEPANETSAAPAEPYGKLFLRFLRFGALAWGGPVAQIDMIRQELVAEEKWVSPAHFKRLLAIYQVLPGPEAHELCVHFGMLSRGRIGGMLAGLGFMLPGFVLIFLLSWLYLSIGLASTAFQAVFLGIQPAVIALIIRACHRIGGHCLTNFPLWTIGVLAAAGEVLGVSFYVTLPLAGVAYVVAAKRQWFLAALAGIAFAVALWQWSPVIAGREPLLPPREMQPRAAMRGRPARPPRPRSLARACGPVCSHLAEPTRPSRSCARTPSSAARGWRNVISSTASRCPEFFPRR